MGMGFIGNIVVGAIVGWLASLIAKTSNQMGCLWNIIIGIVGAAIGHWLADRFINQPATTGFSWQNFLVSIAGAVLLIFALRTIGILKKN